MRLVAALAISIALSFTGSPVLAQEASVRTASLCTENDAPSTLHGSVRDLLTGNPMPGVGVTLRSADFGDVLLAVALSDASGLYVFCGVPRAPGLTVQAEAEGLQSRIVRLPDPPVGEVESLYIEWSAPIDLAGVVIDALSGEPVVGARVEQPTQGSWSFTDDTGRFRVQGQGAGRVVLSTSMLGYSTRVDTLDTASGDLLDLTVRLETEVVMLDPIEVRVRTRQAEQSRRVVSRFDELTTAEIDSLLPRVIDFEGLLRNAQFPGLTVQLGGDGTLCIAQVRGGTECQMAEVYIDGIRMSQAATVLVSFDPNVIESMQFLDSFEAQTRFGGGRLSNGVLVIKTRSGRRPLEEI